MTLRRTTEKFSQRFGGVRVTLSDLVEIESMLPPAPTESYDLQGKRIIKAGDYEVDEVSELAAVADASLPSALIVSMMRVSVSIHGVWAEARSMSDDAESNESARKIAALLRKRRVRRLPGFHTAARVWLYAAWLTVIAGVLFGTSYVLGGIGDDDAAKTVLLVVAATILLAATGAYFWLTTRLPPPHAILLKAQERWIDRHGTLAQIVLAIVGIAVALFFGVRSL